MKYFLQFAIISLICILGQIVSMVLPFPFPASVAGMLILFVLLVTKTVKPNNIKETATWLQENMALYFVPVFVTLLECWDILSNVLFQVVFICVSTTVVTFIITAYTVKLTVKIQDRIRGTK